jgi:isoleucyl-tRNA synthetase
VEVRTNAETAALLQTLGDELKFLLITSNTRVTQVDDSTDPQIIVTPSGDTKCGRCWHWRADVGCDADHPTICGRCVSNLFGVGESRMFV